MAKTEVTFIRVLSKMQCKNAIAFWGVGRGFVETADVIPDVRILCGRIVQFFFGIFILTNSFTFLSAGSKFLHNDLSLGVHTAAIVVLCLLGFTAVGLAWTWWPPL